ncbi:hypothetical protein AB1N83_001023 [Pleurotus pulmonarius]
MLLCSAVLDQTGLDTPVQQRWDRRRRGANRGLRKGHCRRCFDMAAAPRSTPSMSPSSSSGMPPSYNQSCPPCRASKREDSEDSEGMMHEDLLESTFPIRLEDEREYQNYGYVGADFSPYIDLEPLPPPRSPLAVILGTLTFTHSDLRLMRPPRPHDLTTSPLPSPATLRPVPICRKVDAQISITQSDTP